MNSKIEYIPDKDFILSRFSGEVFLRSIKEAATEGLLLSQKTDCYNFIIDLSETIIKISFPEVILFIEGLWRMGFSLKDRVAFIIKNEGNDYIFWETAAVNRGWGKIGFFTSQEEAEKWILNY